MIQEKEKQLISGLVIKNFLLFVVRSKANDRNAGKGHYNIKSGETMMNLLIQIKNFQ
jgi:hypothetical protein